MSKNSLSELKLNLRASDGKPITRNPHNYTEDKIFSNQTQLLLSSLSWISLRIYFYLMSAQQYETDLFLHPISVSFKCSTILEF